MEFVRGQAVRMDLSKSDRWGALFGVPEMCNLFSDGRLFGKIAEHILALEFDNLSLAPEGGPFDLETDDPGVVEVKCVTKGGFDTSPSAMLGAGRTYNADGHLARIKYIASNNGYYILADNRELPIVTFYPVEATEQLIFTNTRGNKTGKRTGNQATAFLTSLLCPVVDNDSQLTTVEK
jgi:hypothetical protein